MQGFATNAIIVQSLLATGVSMRLLQLFAGQKFKL
jgi:hypothetical protein